MLTGLQINPLFLLYSWLVCIQTDKKEYHIFASLFREHRQQCHQQLKVGKDGLASQSFSQPAHWHRPMDPLLPFCTITINTFAYFLWPTARIAFHWQRRFFHCQHLLSDLWLFSLQMNKSGIEEWPQGTGRKLPKKWNPTITLFPRLFLSPSSSYITRFLAS